MRSTQPGAKPPAVRTVKSRDGTTISYQTVGEGPSVIVIPGAMSTAVDYAAFARALAQTFAVHTIERRGRGRSGPQGEPYGIARECEDVAAVREATGSHYLIGHSYGGLIALEAARNNETLRKLAVYEPGVSVGGLISMRWVDGYERKLAEHRALDAFVEFCIAVGPEHVQKTPRWAMKLGVLLADADGKTRKDVPPPALTCSNIERWHASTTPTRIYREVSARTLVMLGGKGGLKRVAPTIKGPSDVLPASEQKTFPKLDRGSDQRIAPLSAGSLAGPVQPWCAERPNGERLTRVRHGHHVFLLDLVAGGGAPFLHQAVVVAHGRTAQ